MIADNDDIYGSTYLIFKRTVSGNKKYGLIAYYYYNEIETLSMQVLSANSRDLYINLLHNGQAFISSDKNTNVGLAINSKENYSTYIDFNNLGKIEYINSTGNGFKFTTGYNYLFYDSFSHENIHYHFLITKIY